jgi:hypothetical protein
MAKPGEPVTIKQYPNRRLYNPGAGGYVTLEDLALMLEDDGLRGLGPGPWDIAFDSQTDHSACKPWLSPKNR